MSGSAITIEFDTSSLINDLDKVDKRIRGQVAVKAVDAGGHQIMNYARINIRNKLNKQPTGALANSIDVVSKQDGSGAVAVVAPHRVYARIHEFGGTIFPRRAKFLTFRVDGHFVRARKVTIPARPYLKPAVTEHEGAIISAMQNEINKELHW